jgi:hypothetical protein
MRRTSRAFVGLALGVPLFVTPEAVAWGGRIDARLPRRISGLESFRAAVAGGYPVLTEGSEALAFTVGPTGPKTVRWHRIEG